MVREKGRKRFAEGEEDPMAGTSNLVDAMLVIAVGLLIFNSCFTNSIFWQFILKKTKSSQLKSDFVSIFVDKRRKIVYNLKWIYFGKVRKIYEIRV